MFIDFPPIAEFVDRSGIVRPIAGCSLIGREEFFERLAQLSECFATKARKDETWEKLYSRNKQVKYLVNRCLELNGIDPDWCTFPMVEALLLQRQGEGEEAIEGYLIELNRPKSSSAESRADADDLSTMAHCIAALSMQTGSIEEAFRLAASTPADTLVGLLKAKAELLETPEQRQKRKFAANREMLKAKFAQMREVG